VIIFPRAIHQNKPPADLLDWSKKTHDHIQAKGHGDLHLKTELAGGTDADSPSKGEDYRSVRKKLDEIGDPVRDLLPGHLAAGNYDADHAAALATDIRKLPPFPLVLPVLPDGSVEVRKIRSLEFEDRGFPKDATWEDIEDFQSRLDEAEGGDDRVFHGELLTYVFINLLEKPAEPPKP